ncbi:aminomethyltransferase family protein [Roseospira navarrensis]|uniref:Aminomethyl transferase family protein n=1 Tax=Roseospira navarrensis TaxID=140058 RepID=A0A7X1ZE95_9PROT|nr:aminomethyltransferase family protein [Roseospira navarrensis]MQX36723.1 aminomethyl transferase family protein [Roseospira navarrensis]
MQDDPAPQTPWPDFFAVVPAPADEARRPTEFAHTFAPHPLVHQERPYDPWYTIYNRRLTAMSMAGASADDTYWRVRRGVILRHTGELPLEVRGPDAERLLNRVFTRDVSRVRVGRCSYQLACQDDGGLLMDGVLVRLAPDRFWYGQANGDLTLWLRAHARGLDVAVFDPDTWVSQVQGPDALRVLEAAVGGAYPDPFRYFDVARVRIADQDVVVTRTGFTNELGWEIYLEPHLDAQAIGDRILEAGRPFDLRPVAIGGARRIEAGLLNAGSDFDETVTPFAAGLGGMVDLDKPDFIGKTALRDADRRARTWGLRVPDGIARLGRGLRRRGTAAAMGRVCSTAWSPYQRCGVAIVRLDAPGPGPGDGLDVACTDSHARPAELCALPMYDPERLIPRGKRVEIPDRPDGDSRS